MELLSLQEIDEDLGLKEAGFGSLQDLEQVLTVLLLVKSNIKLSSGLSKKASDNLGVDLPVIEGLVNDCDEDNNTYDVELLQLTALLLAEEQGDKRAKKVSKYYEKYKAEMEKIYDDYAGESSGLLNDVITTVNKLVQLDQLDV